MPQNYLLSNCKHSKCWRRSVALKKNHPVTVIPPRHQVAVEVVLVVVVEVAQLVVEAVPAVAVEVV